MSLLDLDDVEKKLNESVLNSVGYWFYLSGKVDELSLKKSFPEYNDAVVQSISLAKEIINNEAEWKDVLQHFYNYHSIDSKGLMVDVEEEEILNEKFEYPHEKGSDDFQKKSKSYRFILLGKYVVKEQKIVLFLKSIKDESSRNNFSLENLTTIVLIHELMHAIMDTGKMYGCYSDNSMYAFWKEESYANALTLNAIRKSGNKTLIAEAERFMESQPDPYRYGIYLANLYPNISYMWWKDEKNSAGISIDEQISWLDNAILQSKLISYNRIDISKLIGSISNKLGNCNNLITEDYVRYFLFASMMEQDPDLNHYTLELPYHTLVPTSQPYLFFTQLCDNNLKTPTNQIDQEIDLYYQNEDECLCIEVKFHRHNSSSAPAHTDNAGSLFNDIRRLKCFQSNPKNPCHKLLLYVTDDVMHCYFNGVTKTGTTNGGIRNATGREILKSFYNAKVSQIELSDANFPETFMSASCQSFDIPKSRDFSVSLLQLGSVDVICNSTSMESYNKETTNCHIRLYEIDD